MANFLKALGRIVGKETKDIAKEIPEAIAKRSPEKAISVKEVEDYFAKLPENQEPDQMMVDARDFYHRLTGTDKSYKIPMEEQKRQIEEFAKKKEARQAEITKEQYEDAVRRARYEIPDPDDIVTKQDVARRSESAGEETIPSYAAAAIPVVTSEESGEGFLPKFRKKMSDAYESTIKSAEDYVKEQKNKKSWLNPEPEERGKSMGMSPEEYDQLIQDMAMSSPAMGTTKGLDKLMKFLGK